MAAPFDAGLSVSGLAGLTRDRTLKKPIGRTEGRSSPVVFRAYTITGVLMFPLPLEAIKTSTF